MTDRENMVEAINSVQAYGIMSNAFGGDLPVTNEMLADALIAAGIGDVTAWKERAEKHRVIALPGGRIKQLYSDEEVEQIVKERDELKEREGSEIKSCYKEIAEKRDEIAKLRKQLKRAQNAAKKQKHRAEVAERALRKYIRKVSCSRCPYAMSCDIFPPTPKNDYIECFDEVLRLERKEIAEEQE